MVFDFQTEAGQTDGPTWVTLVEGGKMIFAVGILISDRRSLDLARSLTFGEYFSTAFSLPFFAFPFVFEFVPEIWVAEFGFKRVTPGANASRGASSGTIKNALISNFGETEADARADSSMA
jgi:hypothetical protein